MSSLFLVRHAQASVHADDYDNLSERGVAQAKSLGEAVAHRALPFDAVYVGPKRRHHQTLEHLRARALELDFALPDAVEREALTEIDATVLGEQAMRRVLPSCPNLKEQLASGEPDDTAETALRHYTGIFEALMKRWVGGEFADDVLPYTGFARTVISGVQNIMREQGRQKRVLVVTSGGPISIVSRLALGAPDDKAIELMFALNNASVTELRFTANRLSLVRFNDVGYLPAPMITGI